MEEHLIELKTQRIVMIVVTEKIKGRVHVYVFKSRKKKASGVV